MSVVLLPEGPYPRVDIEEVRVPAARQTFWYAVWTVGFAPASLEVGTEVEPGAGVVQGPLRWTREDAEADARDLEVAARAAHDALLRRTRRRIHLPADVDVAISDG